METQALDKIAFSLQQIAQNTQQNPFLETWLPALISAIIGGLVSFTVAWLVFKAERRSENKKEFLNSILTPIYSFLTNPSEEAFEKIKLLSENPLLTHLSKTQDKNYRLLIKNYPIVTKSLKKVARNMFVEIYQKALLAENPDIHPDDLESCETDDEFFHCLEWAIMDLERFDLEECELEDAQGLNKYYEEKLCKEKIFFESYEDLMQKLHATEAYKDRRQVEKTFDTAKKELLAYINKEIG